MVIYHEHSPSTLCRLPSPAATAHEVHRDAASPSLRLDGSWSEHRC